MTDPHPPQACPFGGRGPGPADPALYRTVEFRAVWARMRERDRLEWTQVDDATGFWSAVRHADVERVLRDPATFTSERGTLLTVLGVDDPAGGRQVAATDPPRHTQMRARLQKALARRSVEQQRDSITRLVRDTLDPLADGGPFDLAEAMLALPVAVGAEAMGLPRADWPWLGRLLTSAIAPEDPAFRTADGVAGTLAAPHRELFAYFLDVYTDRRRHLGDDLVSVLVGTEVDGRAMTPGEILSNCYSLLLGASVTTPHPPTHVVAEHTDDGVLDAWAAAPDATPTAVEEALRLSSPASHFLRYAVTDTEIGGTPICAGDAVVCWLGAANRDAEVFPDPDRFDLFRPRNRHVAFGVGPHYCVGHNIARMTLRAVFDELTTRFRDVRPAGAPVRLESPVIAGYKHLPVTARAV